MYRNLLVQQLKRHEGLRLQPYKCSMGKTTIGYGRNLDDLGITEGEAEELLQNDIDTCLRQTELLPAYDDLDHLRQTVLINMLFNLGLPRLLKFKRMWYAIMGNDWESAANEMLASRWADQVGDRAKELAEMMRTGRANG